MGSSLSLSVKRVSVIAKGLLIELTMDVPLNGPILMVSSPLGIPVIFKYTRMVSSPVLSTISLVFVMLAIVAAVALPPAPC